MPPIYWITAFAVIGILFWRAVRSNRKRAKKQQQAVTVSELSKENYRLRHVLAQVALENHALKYTPPDYW
jgi:hypothetical protein